MAGLDHPRASRKNRNVVIGVEPNHLRLLAFRATRPAALRGWAWMAATSAAMTLWLSRSFADRQPTMRAPPMLLLDRIMNTVLYNFPTNGGGGAGTVGKEKR